LFRNCTDVPFCDAVLMVSIDPAKGDLLMIFSTRVTEEFGGEYAIISMVCFDGTVEA